METVADVKFKCDLSRNRLAGRLVNATASSLGEGESSIDKKSLFCLVDLDAFHRVADSLQGRVQSLG